MLHTLRFFLFKMPFHNATFFGSCIIRIFYIQGVLKFKCQIPVPKGKRVHCYKSKERCCEYYGVPSCVASRFNNLQRVLALVNEISDAVRIVCVIKNIRIQELRGKVATCIRSVNAPQHTDRLPGLPQRPKDSFYKYRTGSRMRLNTTNMEACHFCTRVILSPCEIF
jgi:hypothetical protein